MRQSIFSLIILTFSLPVEIAGDDGLSRMTGATNYENSNSISQITMQYDSQGNLIREDQQIGTQSVKSVVSTFDKVGNRLSLRYPSGKVVNFVPDELDRISQITQAPDNLIAQYSYVGPSRVKERTYGNNTNLTVSYDTNRRITNYETRKTNNDLVMGFEYVFDKEDNRLYEKRTHENKGDAFVYDSIYRLTGVKYEVPNLNTTADYADYTDYEKKGEFRFDGVGNRISVSNSITINYQVNQLNQYTAINGSALLYDKNGNLKDDGTYLYLYDYANRLVQVSRKSDNQVLGEYKYDALGRRIEKKAWRTGGQANAAQKIGVGTGKGQGRENGQGTQNALAKVTEVLQFYYDGARVIEERDGSDTLLRQYVFGNGIDEVLQRTDYNPSGNITDEYYFHENSLGSIYAVTDKNGNVKERYKYTVYGRCTFWEPDGIAEREKSAIGNRFLFIGRELDNETGLYYFRARYYNPTLGRFLQRDPIGYYDSINLYEYVRNNPANKKDPSGLQPPGGGGALPPGSVRGYNPPSVEEQAKEYALHSEMEKREEEIRDFSICFTIFKPHEHNNLLLILRPL